MQPRVVWQQGAHLLQGEQATLKGARPHELRRPGRLWRRALLCVGLLRVLGGMGRLQRAQAA